MGNWPSLRSRWLDIGQVVFFKCLCTETESRSINTQNKKNEANIQPSDPKIWSIEDVLHGIKNKFFLRDTLRNHKRARWRHLSSSGSHMISTDTNHSIQCSFHFFVQGDGRWSEKLNSPMDHSHLESNRSEFWITENNSKTTTQMTMCLTRKASWTSERTWALSRWGFIVTRRFQEKCFTSQPRPTPWGRQWFSISPTRPLPHPRRAIHFQRSRMTTRRFPLTL